MNILIFGGTGFIGKNLVSFLSENHQVEISKINEGDKILLNKIEIADVIINASGVSRSESESDFFLYNIYHGQRVFQIINKFENKMYLYFSSIHYYTDSIYGFSKRYNEFLLEELEFKNKNYFLCLRIPSIFGPGIKPNYVSVVATFCNNIANKISSNIIDGDKVLKLLYIDDLINVISDRIANKSDIGFELIDSFLETEEITVNELYRCINNIELINGNSNKNKRFLSNLSQTYKFYLNKL